MKKINILFILIISFKLTEAQNTFVKQWDKRFGGTNDDFLCSFQQTSDGGYVFGGYSLSGTGGDKTQNSQGDADFWIIKTDSIGNKEWDKRYGGTGLEQLCSILQTFDGGFILGGYSESGIGGDKTQASQGNADYWIVKTDSFGNKQWDKRFGGTDNDYLQSLQQTSDGGFILGGFSYSGIGGDKTQGSQGNFDFWIIKTDLLGNKLWDKRFGGTDAERLNSICQTSDGGFILGGFSSSGIGGDKTQASRGNYDYWLVKTDSIGYKQWDKRFGGASADFLNSIKQTSDGGFILGGWSESGMGGDKAYISFGGFDYWILKTNAMGIKQWDKVFGGNLDEDEFGNVIISADNGFLLSGSSYSQMSGNKTESNQGVEQTWIVKIDSIGSLQWDKTIFTSGHDEKGFAIQTKDGCYAFANITKADTGGYKTQPNWDPTGFTYDYWFIKFCDSTLTSVSEITNAYSIHIYPNPANNILSLFLDKFEDITITSLIGEVVLKKKAKGKVELDVSFLPAGLYIIQTGCTVQKFIKE